MRILLKLLFIFTFVTILGIIIAFARGYRLDLIKQSLTSTGIISVSAFPKASKVYINGQLKGVTDINLTLPPNNYDIEVKKEGYTTWSKKVNLKGELVITLDVLLYPQNPSLSPLTNLGIVRAVPLAQSDRVILFSDNGDSTKDGVYLFDMTNSPLSFLPPLKLLVLKSALTSNLGQIDFKNTQINVSPDNQEAILTFISENGTQISYLFSLQADNKNLYDITTSKSNLLEAWTNQKFQNENKILGAFPKEIAKIASDSFHIVEFSPDDTKVLYFPTKPVILPPAITPPLIATNQTDEDRNLIPNNFYVYDKKEDKNYNISPNLKDQISNLRNFNSLKLDTNFISWYTDSKHLVINEGKRITVIDFDGTNKQTVYSGPFDSSFFKVSTDGRIMILINLNPASNQLPDIYAVGIR